MGGDEVAFSAKIGSHLTHGGFVTLAPHPSADSMRRLLHSSKLALDTFVVEVFIRTGHNHSECAHIPYWYFIRRSKNTLASPGELLDFNLAVSNGHKLAQVSSSMGVAHTKKPVQEGSSPPRYGRVHALDL